MLRSCTTNPVRTSWSTTSRRWSTRARYLVREGWAVLTASDGAEAGPCAGASRSGRARPHAARGGRHRGAARSAPSATPTSSADRETEEVDKLIGLRSAPTTTSPNRSACANWSPDPSDLRRARSMSNRAGLEAIQPRASRGSIEHELTRTEFDILAALAREPGVVIDRPALLASVWGPGYTDDHLVDVHVANLRRKIGDDPSALVRRDGARRRLSPRDRLMRFPADPITARRYPTLWWPSRPWGRSSSRSRSSAPATSLMRWVIGPAIPRARRWMPRPWRHFRMPSARPWSPPS